MLDPLDRLDPASRPRGLASLFAGGQPGHWPDSYNPARGRLFQDAAGATPATAPGQPVGLVKRASGSADASQATALSRPTLGRWPRGGRRNLFNWTEEFDNAYWIKQTGAVVTPNADVAPDGTLTAAKIDLSNITTSAIYRSNVVPAGTYTLSAWAKTFPGFGAVSFKMGSYSVTDLEQLSPELTTTDTWARYSWTFTVTTTNSVYPVLNRASAAARSLLVWGAQVEAGAVATPYQRVTTDFNVTEAGKADVWHLFNDGGDSLPVTLPAGTYGRARVNTEGVVTIDTVVDPTDALSGTRQVDIILRQGAFSAAEEAQIRAYWARYAA